jgi:hypothetical protein
VLGEEITNTPASSLPVTGANPLGMLLVAASLLGGGYCLLQSGKLRQR